MINFFRNHRLPLYFSKPALRHIGEFITAATAKGYRGKVTDLAEWSSCHRTSLGHFLSNGVWDESYIQQIIRQESLKLVRSLSEQTEQPLFVIHDDTVCNKTKPSSQAQHPIEQTDFHYSHLEKKTVWGHQVQATMVQCGDIPLIHDIRRYDKTKQSKIDDACDLAKTMPIPTQSSYALVDSWYTCPKLINAYAARGYHLIGALKTNRILYPQGIHTPLTTLASYVTEKDVRLVTVNGSSYWVYRYEGALNGIENAVVLFCWPENGFQKPKALHAFLCTDVSLETQTILTYKLGKSIIFYNHRERKKEEEYLDKFRKLQNDPDFDGSEWIGLKFIRGTIRDYIFVLQPKNFNPLKNQCKELLETTWKLNFSLLTLGRENCNEKEI